MSRAAEFRRAWPVLAASTAGVATGVGAIPFYALGPFMPSLHEEFGWTRLQMSFALTCLALTLLVASPVAGRLIDRVGVRGVALISSLLFAPTLAALAALPSTIWVLYLLYAMIGIVGSGTGPVTYTRALAGWFERSRGLAFGIALTGTGLAGAATPLLVEAVTSAATWRAAWLALAAFPVLALPILWLGLRDASRALPSGDAPPPAMLGATRAEAFRDRRFWLLGSAIFLISLFVAGFVVHMVPMLTDQGVSGRMAATTASLIGLSVIVGRLLTGWLLDRVFPPYVAAAVFTLTAAGCLFFATTGPIGAPVAAVLLGFAIGAEVDLIAFLLVRYFGLRSYGELYGWQYGFYVVGSAFSPVLIALMHDATGSYSLVLQAGAATIFFAGSMFLLLERRGAVAPFPNS